MKTSNKILLIFFINILLIPVCLCIGYANLVKKNKYTIWQYELGHRKLTIPATGHYSVVKVEAASEEQLVCQFIHSDTLAIRYTNSHVSDSVQVRQVGDTLFIRAAEGANGTVDAAGVEIYLPDAARIITDNAKLVMVSTDTAAASKLDVSVTGNGSFHTSEGMQLQQLSFGTENGKLILAPGSRVGNLSLNINGAGAIQVAEGAAIGDLSGNISKEARINASWDIIHKMSATK